MRASRGRNGRGEERGDHPRGRRAQLPPRDEIAAHHLIDETRLVGGLIERAVYTEDERRRIAELARRLVYAARADRGNHAGVDAFMHEYGLSSEEGVILMCLAEALLRIPDAETADELIAEKIAGGHWERHLGHSDSLFVNASTWGLMLTGRIVKLREARGANPFDALKRLVARSGEPVIRQAVRQAVKLLGDQFVLGRTIREALARARSYEAKGYRFSYDMLGEAAHTEKDADVYFERYMAAIDAVGQAAGPFPTMHADALYGRPGLSIKLSALHPRFEPGKEERLAAELAPALLDACCAPRARAASPLTIDAEEQDRLEPTLDIFAATFTQSRRSTTGRPRHRRAGLRQARHPALRWLRRLAERSGKRIPVRLVKGAYWDSEIKWAQERGLADYPVLTRKLHTDVSFLACMRLLLCRSRRRSIRSSRPTTPTPLPPRSSPPASRSSSSSACTAWARRSTTRSSATASSQARLPHLCPRRRARGPARLSRAPPARERRQHLLRQPACRRRGAGRPDHPRSGRGGRARAQQSRPRRNAPSRVRATSSARAAELPRPPADRAGRARRAASPRWATRSTTSFEVGPIVDGKATTGGDAASLVTCPHDRRERIGTVRIATPAQVDAAIAARRQRRARLGQLGGARRARRSSTAPPTCSSATGRA